MSRPATLFLKPDNSLREAAKRTILACGPLIKELSDDGTFNAERRRKIDEAQGALMQLARSLEAR